MPNDDTDSTDEDNIPSLDDPGNPAYRGARIYSWDMPGNGRDNIWEDYERKTGLQAFYIVRWTFKEWVRVKVNNVGFAEAEQLDGSRASDKKDWSLIHYATLSQYTTQDEKRQYRWNAWTGSGDTYATTYSVPVLVRSGVVTLGDGTATVSLTRYDFTDGYTATYSGATDRWALEEKTTGNIVIANRDQTQGTWTLPLPGKLTLTIRKGVLPFDDNDKFVFSVFHSQGSPSIDLRLESIDVTTPP
jgi:hypothetical protein